MAKWNHVGYESVGNETSYPSVLEGYGLPTAAEADDGRRTANSMSAIKNLLTIQSSLAFRVQERVPDDTVSYIGQPYVDELAPVYKQTTPARGQRW